jgi:hypothetical protein
LVAFGAIYKQQTFHFTKEACMLISLKKGDYFFNADPKSDHVDLQGKIPLFFTRKEAEAEAKKVCWNKNAVKKVFVTGSLLRDHGWAIANISGGGIQVFAIGVDPIFFSGVS